MLRTFTPVVEQLCWRHYRDRYRLPEDALVPQEYHPPFLFISFLDAYRAIATHLRDSLVPRDFKVFVDRDVITIGRQWRLEIAAALEEMEFFLPLLAPGYAAAGETGREYARAVERQALGQAVILPILVEGVPGQFPGFNPAQMLLLREENGRDDPAAWNLAIERLIGGIYGLGVPGVMG